MKGSNIPYELNPIQVQLQSYPLKHVTPKFQTEIPRMNPEIKQTSNDEVAAESFAVVGAIYRERMYATGGPGGMNTSANIPIFPHLTTNSALSTCIGGLMISNSSILAWGKWCVYITVSTVRHVIKPVGSVSSGASENVSSPEPVKVGESSQFFVGKYDTEDEALTHLNLVSTSNIYLFFIILFAKASDIAVHYGYFTHRALIASKKSKVTNLAATIQTSTDSSRVAK
jgi:hypothetical protein